ncbi:MAG: hypothetical protein ACFCVH_18585 [Alphaproteobacteria bacterium]
MNLTHAILIAGIMISIGGSIGLLASTLLAASASGAPAESERLRNPNEDINRLGLPAESPDGPSIASGASVDHAVAVLLARILHRSEAGKTVGR